MATETGAIMLQRLRYETTRGVRQPLLLIALAILLGVTGYSKAIRQEHRMATDLQLTIEADKQRYRIDEPIQLRVFLTNTSSQAVYIPIPLDWGSSASLSIWAYESATKKEIESDMILDAVTPPPRSRDDFTKVLPNHILGLRDSFPLRELGIKAPGKFDLQVEYHSPISGDSIFGLPIRGRQQGSVHSNTISIQVSR